MSTRPCPEGSDEQRLLCHLTELRLGPEFSTPEEQRRPLGAWECVPGDLTVIRTDTPTPWIFGQSACVEASRGNAAGQRVRLCGADAAN